MGHLGHCDALKSGPKDTEIYSPGEKETSKNEIRDKGWGDLEGGREVWKLLTQTLRCWHLAAPPTQSILRAQGNV